jgi:betaine-aldehyde dehydrogenase
MPYNVPYDMLFSGGTWKPPHGRETIEVENPATEKVIGTVPRGDAADVDRAAGDAREALPRWSKTSWRDRQGYLRLIADALDVEAEEIAQTIVSELGMPLDATLSVQAREPATIFRAYADEMDRLAWENGVANSFIVSEPVGVVGAITPWNYPLYQIACKVGAALAAGCTVVLKPSELTPFNAYALIYAAEKADLPPGVINLVTGLGEEVGEALVAHPEIDLISFTGSTRAGRRIASVAGNALKPVLLELGGKSASIVLEDADFNRAVVETARMCFKNSGQSCSAHTRLLVPRNKCDLATSIADEYARNVLLGDPTAHGDHLGPVVSDHQRKRVRDYIDAGVASGDRLVAGGSAAPKGMERGYYVQPTVFTNVDPRAAIAQEEIFGPVLCILAYDDQADAVRIANSTPYGLSAGVWSGSDSEGVEVSRDLRAGEVFVNGAPFNVQAPFGGVGQSGFGRELGAYGIEEFLVTKAIHLSSPNSVELELSKTK